MPRNRCPNFPPFPLQFPAQDRVVNLGYSPSGKLRRKREVRFVILGHDHAPACFFVQTMNNTRARHTAYAT
jgi:hypothetical protein